MRWPWDTIKVGVALGGGAARGVAHVGVLRAMVREGIPVHVIAGTSMGAIIGGAYAATTDMDLVERKIREVLSSEQFRKNRLSFLKETKHRRGGLLYSVANLVRKGIVYGISTLKPSLVSAEAIAADIAMVLPDVRIEECRIPFAAVALDIEDAVEVVLCHGSLRKAASASSAIPGVLPPVRMNGRVLIDGGWVDKMPILPAFRMGADVVIAVDISADLEDTRNYTRGIDIMLRANAIKDTVLSGFTGNLADVVIKPEVKKLHWADFDSHDRCIQAGDDAATQAVPAVRKILRRARWRTMLRPGIGKRVAELYLSSENMHCSME
jgi:NTE family protein